MTTFPGARIVNVIDRAPKPDEDAAAAPEAGAAPDEGEADDP